MVLYHLKKNPHGCEEPCGFCVYLLCCRCINQDKSRQKLHCNLNDNRNVILFDIFAHRLCDLHFDIINNFASVNIKRVCKFFKKHIFSKAQIILIG